MGGWVSVCVFRFAQPVQYLEQAIWGPWGRVVFCDWSQNYSRAIVGKRKPENIVTKKGVCVKYHVTSTGDPVSVLLECLLLQVLMHPRAPVPVNCSVCSALRQTHPPSAHLWAGGCPKRLLFRFRSVFCDHFCTQRGWGGWGRGVQARSIPPLYPSLIWSIPLICSTCCFRVGPKSIDGVPDKAQKATTGRSRGQKTSRARHFFIIGCEFNMGAGVLGCR